MAQPNPANRRKGRPAYRSTLGPAKSLMLRLPESLHRPIKILAASRGFSLNDTLIQLIEEAFARVPERAVFERLAAQAAGTASDGLNREASSPAESPARRRPRGR